MEETIRIFTEIQINKDLKVTQVKENGIFDNISIEVRDDEVMIIDQAAIPELIQALDQLLKGPKLLDDSADSRKADPNFENQII